MNEPGAVRHGAVGHCHLQGHHISNTMFDAALLLGTSLSVFAMIGMCHVPLRGSQQGILHGLGSLSSLTYK